MYYPDGQSPPDQILSEWLQLLSGTFENISKDDTPCIAIHCVAGLGRFDVRQFQKLKWYTISKHISVLRAPVLVAIALIEYGMEAVPAVTFIREKRLFMIEFCIILCIYNCMHVCMYVSM